MSKTTKIVVLVNVIASFLLAIIIGSTLYAWYVKTSHTESVDVTTNGIVLSYQIDDSEEINVQTYNISNLAFFDIDSEYEGKYFSTMAHMIEVKITNKSKKKVDITLSYVDISSDENPYVACIITNNTTVLNSSAFDGSVEDYISTNNLEDNYKYLNVEKNTTKTYYVYIYGVQPDDDASNDFLYSNQAQNIGQTYQFELQIEAVISEGQEADITETTKEASTETETSSTTTQTN